MSPITDIQPQLPTVYRLRMGHQVAAGAKTRPAHLDGKIRVTSLMRGVVEQIADAYSGGEVTPWASPDGPQYQTILPAEPLQVIIMPGQALSQWWERWNAGGCTHRCDGQTETIEARPCVCPDPKARLADRGKFCLPITRLTVLLPRVKLLAAGRLDAHGLIAAQGLGATIALAQAALDSGQLVRATLTVRRRGTGAKQYVWPELTVSQTPLPQGFAIGQGVPAPAIPARVPPLPAMIEEGS